MSQLIIRSAKNHGWMVSRYDPMVRGYSSDEYVFTDIHAMNAWIKDYYEKGIDDDRHLSCIKAQVDSSFNAG